MKKTNKQKGWRKCGATGSPHGCRHVKWYNPLEKRSGSFFYETKHIPNQGLNDFIVRCLFKMNKDMCLHTHTHNLYKNVHSSFIHNIQKKKVETAQVSINRKVEKRQYSAMKRNEPLIQAT